VGLLCEWGRKVWQKYFSDYDIGYHNYKVPLVSSTVDQSKGVSGEYPWCSISSIKVNCRPS
jgi:hypothetical protein